MSTTGFGLNAPGYALRDVADWLDGQILSDDRLGPELRAITARELTGRFALPVFVILGSEDFTTPTSLGRAFVDGVEAPRKAFVTIKGGHFEAFMNPPEFLRELSRLVAITARQERAKAGSRRGQVA